MLADRQQVLPVAGREDVSPCLDGACQDRIVRRVSAERVDKPGGGQQLVSDGAQGRTKSEFVREALRRQVLLGRLRALQSYGRRQAEERGLGPEDAESLVDELRGRRS